MATGASKREGRVGLAYAVGAFAAWGLAPIYFKALQTLAATEIVAHRVLWSVLLLAGLLHVTRGWGEVRAAWARPSNRRVFIVTTLLISFNWLLFIWATNSGRLLEGSLGYFINPLVSVVLGVVFLGERLGRVQKIAVGLAALGVLNLVVTHGTIPWVSLCLAASFGLYGLLRKKVPVASTTGLFLETALMAPFALAWLAWLAWTGGLGFATAGPGLKALIAASGVITALPLLWFVAGARRLKLATVGLIQYLAPTGQFLLAVLAYDEPFTTAHAVTFGLIWTSLALYSANAVWPRRVATLSPQGS